MVNENSTTKTIKWHYICPLVPNRPRCVAFAAINTEDEKQILVVKFVGRYDDKAHKELMAVHRAPELLYCGDVWSGTPKRHGFGPLKMVVMKYPLGKTLREKYYLSGRVPESVRKAVHEAVELLQQKNLFHGDIRHQNIMIEDCDGDEGERVRLLDFDWAGRAGEITYPHDLSKNIFWPERAGDFKLISTDHDLQMVDRL